MIQEIRFARDSPLEEGGFELLVPGMVSSVAAPCQSITDEV